MTQGRIRISANSIHGATAWVIPILLGFVVTPLLVASLGVKGYGIYSLVVGLIQYSFNLQFGRAMTNYVAKVRAGNDAFRKFCTSTLVLAILVAFVGSLTIALSADVLVSEYFRISPELQSETTEVVRIAAVVLMSMAVLYLSWSVLHGMEFFSTFSKLSGGYSVSVALGSVSVALAGGGLRSILALQLFITLGFLISTLVLLSKSGARRFFDTKPDLDSLKSVFRSAMPIIGYQVVGNAVVLIERGLVSARLGEAALSYYVVAMNLAINLNGLAASLSLAILPVASQKESDWEGFRATYEKATTYIIALMTGIMTTVVIFGEQFLQVWLGMEFAESAILVLIPGVLAFGLHSFSVIVFQVADGTGRSRLNLITTFLAGVVFVIVAFATIDGFGIESPAFARLASAMIWLMYMFVVDRIIRGSWGIGFFSRVFATLIPAIAMSSVVGIFVQQLWSGQWTSVIVGSAVTSFVFLFFAILFGVIRFQEIRELLKQFKGSR